MSLLVKFYIKLTSKTCFTGKIFIENNLELKIHGSKLTEFFPLLEF